MELYRKPKISANINLERKESIEKRLGIWKQIPLFDGLKRFLDKISFYLCKQLNDSVNVGTSSWTDIFYEYNVI
jgi:hypothetical protein